MLCRKALQQLMADFRRFGSSVVFASADRLLVQTTKSEVGNAYAYSQYIVKSLKAKPLFNFLDLEIKEYWDYLLWYDAYNYGGKACEQVVEADEQTLDCIMHWQLNRFLPPLMQGIFNDWIVEYIELMHSFKRRPRHTVSALPPSPPQQQQQQQQQTQDRSFIRLTQLPPDAQADEEQRALLQNSFAKPLKKQIAGLIRRQQKEMLHPELASDYVFPQLPGAAALGPLANSGNSNSNNNNPALQLVKSIMQVLSLDANTMLESRLLRKELLAMFDVREFSAAATFVNPSESLRLEQVVCDGCTMARDLDLCRDEDITATADPASAAAAASAVGGSGVDGSSGSGAPWRCIWCGHEYDRLAIEARLIAHIERMLIDWNTQDLRCVKCRGVCLNEFLEHCACGGEWGESLARDELLRKLRVYGSVAATYGFQMLAAAVTSAAEGL
jgi:DNA polymerase epsilon subunit 1